MAGTFAGGENPHQAECDVAGGLVGGGIEGAEVQSTEKGVASSFEHDVEKGASRDSAAAVAAGAGTKAVGENEAAATAAGDLAELKRASARARSEEAAREADAAAARPSEPDTGSSGSEPVKHMASEKCSFTPDTPVLMAKGKTKPIGKIKPGDKVEAADPKNGRHQGPHKVTATWVNHDYDLIDLRVRLADGTAATVHTTAKHPFWDDTRHTWVRASALKPGHALNTATDQHVHVTKVNKRPGDRDMYNLTVSRLHTYYVLAGATPVLVHNCNLSARASEIHAAEPDEFVRKNVSTVAVIRADTPHGPINVVAGSGDGLTPAQMSAIGKGEVFADNIPGAHAEQNALLFINEMGWTPISGGTSRNVCLGRCAPLIRGSGGKMMGEVYPGSGKTTTRQRSFEW
ncbi:Hint domain-containing protein [Streptomyces sp. NPDC048045]|uniref:Hint domain-containing protein n=1 Tax=Streptomyces sp. NPDC048045 TaxID=3154710 RepID=UPI00342B1ACB